MAFSLVVVLSVVASNAADPPAVGTIEGVVRFVAKPPAPRTVTVADGSTIQHRDLVVDPATKGLRDVYVVIADAPPRPLANGVRPAVMDQWEWVFVPRVLGVQLGQAVAFQNNDGVNHGVHAASPIADNQFNVVLATGSEYQYVFAYQSEPIPMGCALHPWMRGWVFVARHPWFAVTDAKGAFILRDVPPGKWRLECRHPDVNLRALREVEVGAGRTARVAIEWDQVPPGK